MTKESPTPAPRKEGPAKVENVRSRSGIVDYNILKVAGITVIQDELWVGGVKVHNHLQNENFMAEEKAKLINAAYRLAAREVEKKAYRRAAEITRKAGVPGAADVILRMAEEA